MVVGAVSPARRDGHAGLSRAVRNRIRRYGTEKTVVVLMSREVIRENRNGQDELMENGTGVMRRQLVSTGSVCEDVVGFSRAVRVGPWVSVAGTTATTPDGPVGGADVAAQTREALRRIRGALSDAGATVGDVVRTRIFVSDIDDWEEVGRVHKEFFGNTLPANTLVQAGLADSRLLCQ